MKMRWAHRGRSRGLLERKDRVDPGALSQKLVGVGGRELLVVLASCKPAGVHTPVCICVTYWARRPLLWLLCVYVCAWGG